MALVRADAMFKLYPAKAVMNDINDLKLKKERNEALKKVRELQALWWTDEYKEARKRFNELNAKYHEQLQKQQ